MAWQFGWLCRWPPFTPTHCAVAEATVPGDGLTPVRYQAGHLSDAVDPKIASLVGAAKQKRLVVYVGAGLSVALPANGPLGRMVADRLRRPVSVMLSVSETELAAADTLEKLAQRVADAAPHRLDELRALAATAFDFAGLDPNFGHDAAALMMREGFIEVVSVNWDCAIERAGTRIEIHIEGVATASQRLQMVNNGLPLYKVHGCCLRPASLALTQSEVDKPQDWAVAQVHSALVGGVVVFVGLGTVGLYVQEPMSQLWDVWGSSSSVLVVDPELPSIWEGILRDHATTSHVRSDADSFLDGLLRALVFDALMGVEQAVIVLDQNETWAAEMKKGCIEFRSAVQDMGAEEILRWWRDGVIDTEAGKPFVTELRGKQPLMTTMLLAGQDGGPIQARGTRGRMTVASGRRYFEVVCRPGEHVSQVTTVARARVERRRDEGVYLDSRPVTVVVAEAIGQFPSFDAPLDIAGSEGDLNDIVGFAANPVRVVAADDGVRGRLSA